MIDMLKRHEIQVLRRADHTWPEIAALSGVSEKTARRIAAEAPVTSVDNPAERARRQVGRPSTAEAYREVVVQALTEDASLRSVELLHRARQAGYTGGKSALYALAQTLRIRTVTPLVRFEGLPGEFSQHDFGEVWVTYQDGTETKLHFFTSRLKYSRWVEVTLVPDERVETLVRSLVDHLAAFGGIPLVTVFDRPEPIAPKWGRDGVVTEWNPTFAGVALDLGIGVEVCWPYRPQEKGSVENLVGWVNGSFFKQRRFLDHLELERQLREWLTDANTSRPSRATGVPPAARIAEDRALAPVENRRSGFGAADSSERHADRRRDARWPSVLDARRRDRITRHAVSGSRPCADHRGPIQRRASTEIRAGRRVDPARAPGATRGRGVWEARPSLFAAPASDRSRCGRARVSDGADASTAAHVDSRGRALARAATNARRCGAP